MKIAAVVVTYNRKALLERVIQCLKASTVAVDIIVVNNGSTDGTAEWLAAQSGLRVIHQANVGGSGGFYTGILAAFDAGADLIWCMDDDVFPATDCLATLLTEKQTLGERVGILCPRRMQRGEVFVNECRQLDLTHTFASLHKRRLTATEPVPVDIEGMVFEGPLISREVVEKIGLPNKDLFIFFDDTDYSYRAVQAGFRVVYVPDAVLEKEKFFTSDTWVVKQQKKKWKRRYQIRNAAYFNHHYGRHFGVRYVRPFVSALGSISTALWLAIWRRGYSWTDVKSFWKAYLDGVSEHLGIY